MIGYKLTDAEGYTRRRRAGETKWEVGEVVYPTGKGKEACGPGVLHDYSHPLLALFLNPIHANLTNPRLFQVEHLGRTPKTDGLKRWASGPLRVLEELPLPNITLNMRVRFAIYCALAVYAEEGFVRWAEGWLEGKDRSAAGGEAARAAARGAAMAARNAAGAAAWAAWAARGAAGTAAWAAREAAAAVVWAARDATNGIDLSILVERAVREELA